MKLTFWASPVEQFVTLSGVTITEHPCTVKCWDIVTNRFAIPKQYPIITVYVLQWDY